MEFPSKLLDKAVGEIALLPGIGKRTALRLVLHLLRQPKSQSVDLADAIKELRLQIQYCESCYNISDAKLCSICANQNRDAELICVVEDIRDVMAIEGTSSYNGVYHVLGGKISPMDGIGPHDLNIAPLVEKVRQGMVRELVFAMSPTIEGDTTNFYIYRQLSEMPVQMSTIARGVAAGSDLEYTDDVTLGRSIIDRIPFEASLKN
jgi:recombination protein RecR